MNKNNIDKIFKEKLKDFEEVPDEHVWKSIETSLEGKRRSRKLVPFWWKLGGVAAVLALLLYIVGPFENTDLDKPVITDTETPEAVQPAEQSPADPYSEIPADASDPLVTTPVDENKDRSGESLPNPAKKEDNGNNAVVNLQTEREQYSPNTPNKTSGRTPSVTTMDDTDENAPDLLRDPLLTEKVRKEASQNDLPAAELTQTESQKPSDIEREQGQAVKEPANLLNDNSNNPVAAIEAEKKQAAEIAEAKKSLLSEMEEIEDLAETENKSARWSVGPKVAPVYFDSFGKGSPIHPNFAPNAKSGNINLSYGLSVAYKLAKKLSVRSGIHKVDYGYDTNDISFSSSLVASTNSQINTIDYVFTSRNLVVESNTGTKVVPEAMATDVSAPSPSREGRMVQQFGYLEVPLELNYSLIESKFGVDLIGGVSSMFLVDNSVMLESNGSATEMGEANNINSLNFSTNIGFGINYAISPKMQFNVEPVFKYQMNTFSATAGDFRPFSIGVYSGLNFKF